MADTCLAEMGNCWAFRRLTKPEPDRTLAPKVAS